MSNGKSISIRRKHDFVSQSIAFFLQRKVHKQQKLHSLCKILSWYSLLYLSKYLDQVTAKGPFPYSSQAATCY